MFGFLKKETGDRIEMWVQDRALPRLLTSHAALAFCYGIFLLLYEVNYFRELIPVVHPFLIAWAGLLAVYDVLVRRLWKKLPLWQLLVAFAIVACITALVNRETGLVAHVKTLVLMFLPLVAFYPLCLLCEKQEREKVLLKALSGAAVVAFLASLVALVLYLMRVSTQLELFGISRLVGYRNYIVGDPTSGILLYGLYTDTNHAASYAIVFAVYSLWLLDAYRRGVCGKWAKVFAIANLAVQACYFPLANSRGGWLCLGAAVAVCFFLWCFCTRLKKSGAFKRTAFSLLTAVVSVAVLCGGLLMLRSGMAIVSNAVHYKPATTVKPPDTGTSSTDETEPSLEWTEPAVDSFEKVNDIPGAGRLLIWKEALQLYTHNPVLGVGAGNEGLFARMYNIGEKLMQGSAMHNSYLDLLVGYGALGFLALMGFFVGCVWIVLRKFFQKDGEISTVTYLSAFGVLALAGTSAFLSCAFINTTAIYFLMMCLLSFLMAQCTDKDVKA